jgi:IS30 family transposase
MAGAFSQEIRRLRAEGYSFEAIREALAKAGVAVSNSTVQREARRTSARRSGSESDTPR